MRYFPVKLIIPSIVLLSFRFIFSLYFSILSTIIRLWHTSGNYKGKIKDGGSKVNETNNDCQSQHRGINQRAETKDLSKLEQYGRGAELLQNRQQGLLPSRRADELGNLEKD